MPHQDEVGSATINDAAPGQTSRSVEVDGLTTSMLSKAGRSTSLVHYRRNLRYGGSH